MTVAASASEPEFGENFSWNDLFPETGNPLDTRAVGRVMGPTAPPKWAIQDPVFRAELEDPRALADCSSFGRWLAKGGFAAITLPFWSLGEAGEDVMAYRSLVLAILSHLPTAQICIDGYAPHLHALTGLWPGYLRVGPVQDAWLSNASARLIGSDGPIGGAEDSVRSSSPAAPQSRLATPLALEAELAELTEMLAARDLPNGPLATGTTSRDVGGLAANAIIPSALAGAHGLHIGDGLVLRNWNAQSKSAPGFGCPDLGYHLMSVTTENGGKEIEGLSRVSLDPRRSQVVAGDTVHTVTVTAAGRVTVELCALTVLGADSQDRYALLADPAPKIPGATVFYFTVDWQVIGLAQQRFPASVGQDKTMFPEWHEQEVVAVLRTKSIWDDLTARADLGCVRSADILRALARAQPVTEETEASRDFVSEVSSGG